MGHIFSREFSKRSFCTDPFIIPFLVWALTLQIRPSFPGKVSTIFPSFHFPLGMSSSDMSTTPLCFNGTSSLVHCWWTVKPGKYSRNQRNQKWLWSRCWYLKRSERETSAFLGGASGGRPKSLPMAALWNVFWLSEWITFPIPRR